LNKNQDIQISDMKKTYSQLKQIENSSQKTKLHEHFKKLLKCSIVDRILRNSFRTSGVQSQKFHKFVRLFKIGFKTSKF